MPGRVSWALRESLGLGGWGQRPQPASSRDASLEQKLREFPSGGGEWERPRASVPGVFIVKPPG